LWWLSLGLLASRENDHEAEFKYASAAVRLSPSNKNGWGLMAHALLETGELNGALEAAQRAAQIPPQEYGPYLVLAECYSRLGNLGLTAGRRGSAAWPAPFLAGHAGSSGDARGGPPDPVPFAAKGTGRRTGPHRSRHGQA
jgi:tetratricopeptide (TPR) repeat protein